MNENKEVTLDFKALERVGGVKFTPEQRDGLLGAAAILRLEATRPLEDLPMKTQRRKFAEGIDAGERFLEFLDFFIKLGSRYFGHAELWGDDEAQEQIASNAVAILTHRRQLTALLPALCEFKEKFRGKPGRKAGIPPIFVALVDRVCRDAGAKGPYYSDYDRRYHGAVLSIAEEILSQIHYRDVSQYTLAKAILNSRTSPHHR